MPPEAETAKIDNIQAELQSLLDETANPAVSMSLRHALYYCHLAKGFLGDDGLSPELDGMYKQD